MVKLRILFFGNFLGVSKPYSLHIVQKLPFSGSFLYCLRLGFFLFLIFCLFFLRGLWGYKIKKDALDHIHTT
jgi:hypothetical protein